MGNKHKSTSPQIPENEGVEVQNSPCTKIDKSHIALIVLCILLIAFSLSSSTALLAVNARNSGIFNSSGLTIFILFVAVLISMFSGGAIYMSWRKTTWFLHIYQFICLVVLVSFILVLISIIMTSSQTTSSTDSSSNMLSACNSPSNYFQYQMQTISKNAANLICTSNCPCPQYTQVQQCPQWQTTPYQVIMSAMEIQFGCSGWCEVNHNANFMFSGVKSDLLPTGPCFNEWANWVDSQLKAIIGCVSTIVVLLYFNILSVNWRILKICNQND